MSKLKIVFSTLIVGLLTAGCICLGLPLSTQNFEPPVSANETVVNDIKPYLNIGTTATKHEDFVYLMSSGNTLDLQIATNTIDKTIDGTTKTNYAYIPNKKNNQEFYYFDINTIALYYNVTNDNISSVQNLTNLLPVSASDNFCSSHENPFNPTGYSFAPEQLDMQIALQKRNTSISIDGNTVTLAEEGAYTLAINMDVYYTTNGGNSFSILDEESELFYTFMMFDYTTYFDSASNRPKTTMTNCMREALLNSTQSQTHSTYYFYNYSNNNLPNFEYDSRFYEMSVRFVNTENIPYYATIKYNNGKLYFLDANGREINPDFFFAMDNSGKINLTFNELGTYDLIFNLVYTVGEHVYDLPLTTLHQRLYVFGYQVYYTDLGTTDPDTNTTVQKEFKTINANKTAFKDGADITNQVTITKTNVNEIKTEIKESLKNIALATTNQAPIKFKSNITPATTDSTVNSKIYTLQNSGDFDGGKTFDGGNITVAGTYLVITDYTYSNFTADNGVPQTTVHHYQVFYFTYDDKISTYEVKAGDQELSNRAYTNQNVTITNNSAKNPYDAQATITLSAVNYLNNEPLWNGERDISSFNNGTDDFGIDYDNNNYEVNIPSSTNAVFTVRIYEKNSEVPTTSVFTIDTTPIKNLTAMTASATTNNLYRLGKALEGNKSNQPLVFSWDQKDSGAMTYGYYNFYPLTSADFYHHTELGDSALIDYLYRKGKDFFLPIEAKLDLTKNNTTWPKYENASGYTTTLPKSYVKEEAGLYIIEVYDQAGNCDFGVYLIDKSSPIFIKTVETYSGGSKSILSSGDIITIPEQEELDNGYSVAIEWAPYKAIFLNGFDIENFNVYNANNASISDVSLQDKLREELKAFFGAEKNSTTGITTYNNIGRIEGDLSATPPAGWNNAGEENTKYRGDYLKIAIDSDHLFKDIEANTPALDQGYSHAITLISNNKANEGTYSFYLRDGSNISRTGNIENDLLNHPSVYLSVTVSSDSSKLRVVSGDNTIMEYEAYSYAGIFYENKSELSYNEEKDFVPSSLNYKFAYYVPVKTESNLNISFVPFAKDGNKVESIEVRYYGYKKVSAPVKVFDENNQEEEEALGQTYYYTLEDEYEPIPVFQYTHEYEQGREITAPLSSSGGTTIANPGKYVIVRRYFKENTSTNTYDFFERNITLMVDRYNVISEREDVTGKDEDGNDNGKISSQSLVGHDMLVTMYSLPTQSSIQVSFPYMNKDSGLNSGSFHTSDITSDNISISTSLTTNKLPLSVKVPKYKYTTNYNYFTEDNSYSVDKNNTLSYFGNAKIDHTDGDPYYYVIVEGVKHRFDTEEEANEYLAKTIIPEYELYAEIEFKATDASIPIHYKTNGTMTKGYLNFYEVTNLGDSISETSKPAVFTKAGNYEVKIYQAQNRGQAASFSNSYRFKFVISSPQPDFTVYNGNNLKANFVTDGDIDTYYVNTKKISIKWQDSDSRYIANLDRNKDKIKITIDGTTLKSEEFEVENDGLLAHHIDLNLEKYWKNGTELSITMQLEGHSENYGEDYSDLNNYGKVTKKVVIDYTAPLENLADLMSNVTNSYSSFTRTYQEINMRTLQDYNGDEIDTSGWDLNWNDETALNEKLQNVSYSYSKSSLPFKYYAYNVTTDFFSNLQAQITDKEHPPLPTDAKYIYYKEIGNMNEYLTNYTQTRNFSEYNYNSIEYLDTISSDTLYEIAERDVAGNTTIYIVHVYEPSKNTAISYKNSNETISIDNAELKDGFDIFSITGFELQELNYLSDPWGIYELNLYNHRPALYMKSPWSKLNSNEQDIDTTIYRLENSGGRINLVETDIKSIFTGMPSGERKHHVSLINRYLGTSIDLRISILNATYNDSNTRKDSTPTTATLELRVPTLEQATSADYAWLYPKEIRISQRIAASQSVWEEFGAFTNNTANPSLWTSNNSAISLNYANGYLVITINLAEYNVFKYEILDNFNQTSTIFQYLDEPDFDEITGTKNVYTTPSEADGSTTYLTSGDITYRYNSLIFDINIFDKDRKDITDTITKRTDPKTNITSITFRKGEQSELLYFIELSDLIEKKANSKINIRIYDKLPTFYDNNNATGSFIWFQDKNNNPISGKQSSRYETISIDGKFYSAQSMLLTTYSNSVTALFSASHSSYTDINYSYNNQYSYSIYFSNDNGNTWLNVNDFATNGFNFIGAGDYKFLVAYDDYSILNDACQIYSIKILDSSSVYYTVSLSDGELVEKARDTDGNLLKYTIYNDDNLPTETITENYIVSVDYGDHDSVNKTGSTELNIKLNLIRHYPAGNGVEVELWNYSGANITGKFSVIYIGKTDDRDRPLLDLLTYEDVSSTPNIDLHNNNLQIPVNSEGFTLKLNWTDHFGIDENKINIYVEKLFNNSYIKVDVKVYSNGTTRYTTLSRAGTYRIRFYDSCTPSNEQYFGSINNNYLNLVLLNTTPFTVSYKDPNTGDTLITEPNTKAVYNGEVTLSLSNHFSYFHHAPDIEVHKDGNEEPYTGYDTSTNNYTYTFKENGYYVVKFTNAETKEGEPIGEEEFVFTIINPNESRYAYEFSPYSNYYVQKVMKNGLDITGALVSLANKNDLVTVDSKQYLTKLLLSYFDERSGAGRYTITINTGEQIYTNAISEFTFSLWINLATPPVTVSIANGGATTDNISLRFNAYDLYDTVGDCYIQIGSDRYDINAETLSSIGGEGAGITITRNGTYYIQIYTMSDTLLYSYKVTKNEPLNTWAIIAIVIGVLAVGVVIFITIKLRKRLKVK